MPNRATRPAALLLAISLAAGLAACGGSAGASAPPSGPAGSPRATQAASGTPAPSASPDADRVDHATGATDVVLRVSESGGFMMVEAVMGRLPLFTLYGDGRVLVQPVANGAGINGPGAPAVLRETRLTEDQVQDLLRYALTDGALGISREEFPVLVMDVPTTVIELHAGGIDKTVKAAGLSLDPQPGPDAAVLRRLATLVDALRGIRTDADYVPPALAGVLWESGDQPGVTAAPWPWTDLAPADFTGPPAGQDGFPVHVLTAAQAAAIGSAPGASATFKAADGRTYVVLLRAALPEEMAAP